jgi:GTP-binding protein SAR1
VDAIVFIIDTADRDRLPESKKELDTLLSEELLADKPFLILGNKCDVPGCTNEQELRQIMGLLDTTGREKTTREAGVRPIELFMCSLTKRYGYGEGLKWLTNFV